MQAVTRTNSHDYDGHDVIAYFAHDSIISDSVTSKSARATNLFMDGARAWLASERG